MQCRQSASKSLVKSSEEVLDSDDPTFYEDAYWQRVDEEYAEWKDELINQSPEKLREESK